MSHPWFTAFLPEDVILLMLIAALLSSEHLVTSSLIQDAAISEYLK